jgi:aminoglycoside phosphotransferase family enzyme
MLAEDTTIPNARQWMAAIRASVGAGTTVELIETPLSCVYLTKYYALKVKKAVELGEARFRNPTHRRQACIDEVWLNQRLAPGVYLGVMPVSFATPACLRLGGQGIVVDWTVKMRRLADQCNLLTLMHRGAVSNLQISALAQVLAEFYHARPPEPASPDEFYLRLRARVTEQAGPLLTNAPVCVHPTVRRILVAQERFLARARHQLDMRACDGRIVDGHGDLRPEHVFMERRPIVIDCVEYSAARRRSDALDDLCRLAMECERLGRDDISAGLLAAYRQAAGDGGCRQLGAVYKSLQASARASALVQRSDSNGASRELLAHAMAYLDLSESYIRQF